MSLLRKPECETCACRAAPSTGTFNLRVEPRTVDVRDQVTRDEIAQLQRSEHLQQLFFPNFTTVDVQQHGEGFHVHPKHAEKVAHIGQLHELMDEDDLVARVQITPSHEHTAVSASLTGQHVDDLLSNGTVDLQVPLDQGTFRLHSTKEGRITAVEYVH